LRSIIALHELEGGNLGDITYKATEAQR
jgi:hypothetical protein